MVLVYGIVQNFQPKNVTHRSKLSIHFILIRLYISKRHLLNEGKYRYIFYINSRLRPKVLNKYLN